MKANHSDNLDNKSTDGSRPVILVIEDNPECTKIYLALSQSLGCEAYFAADGAAALRVLDGLTRLDLILLDLDMPVMNGIRFYNHYKKQTSTPEVNIILTSSHPFAEDIAEALNFFAYVPKSRPLNQLQEAVVLALS
ncbi:MAG: response regulator [bacterium]